jgi:hypothetical protein
MDSITTYRETEVRVLWVVCGQRLADVLTADEWSHESHRFSLIAEAPDLRHPVTGLVELRPTSGAALDEGAHRYHRDAREAIASLADVLTTTIEAAASV